MNSHSLSIVFTQEKWEKTRNQVFKDSPNEGVVFIACGLAQHSFGTKFLAQRLLIPRKEDLTTQSPGGIAVTQRFFAQVLTACKQEKLQLVHCHSHPFSKYGVHFSSIDDGYDGALFKYSASKLPEMGHCSLVLGWESCQARVCGDGNGGFNYVSRVIVVGDRIELVPHTENRHG